MSTDLDAPADISMMGIVHGALRRDLQRTRMVLEGEDVPDARRSALGQHAVWMMEFLKEHHSGEDLGLYPMVRAKDPSLAPLLDAMDAEHEAVHPAIEAVEVAGRRYANDPGAKAGLVAALDQLDAVLSPHLKHEEEELMPLVSKTVTVRDWQKYDQDFNVGPKKTTELAMQGHWLIDNANAQDRNTVVHVVPAVPRFFLINFMGGAYRRRRAALWDGTPAADVPLLTLAELARRG